MSSFPTVDGFAHGTRALSASVRVRVTRTEQRDPGSVRRQCLQQKRRGQVGRQHQASRALCYLPMLARWLASLARCPRPRALIASKGKARTPHTSTFPCPFLLPTRLQTRTRRMHSPINPNGSSHRLWREQCGVVRCRATPKRVRALGGRYGWTSVELTLYARAAGGVDHATTRGL